MTEPRLHVTRASDDYKSWRYGNCSLGDWNAGPFTNSELAIAFDLHVREAHGEPEVFDTLTCQCGWGIEQHKGKKGGRRGYRTTFGTWQKGCRAFVPQKKWDIVYSHGIGAPDAERAQEMVKTIITSSFGPVMGEKVWERIGFNFEVVERMPKQ